MAYLALARKWRPKAFSEVVGQSHVVQALSNALDSGRVHHAFLFTGTRGVGKTTLARIFAKSLNCEQGISAEPCQQCNTCRSIDEGRYVDLREVDAASRTKVDDTRELLENIHYAPTVGKYTVFLIDEVHMLSTHSFNALLKTLEEPPEHVKFLFATTDPQKLPVTVLSRCLQFNLRAMRPEQVENQLVKILGSEQIEFDQAALHAIAKAADGSMRDGLSLLDQAIAQGGGRVNRTDVDSMLGTIKSAHTEAILNSLAHRDVDQVMSVVAEMADSAVDFSAALDDVLMQLYYVSLAQFSPASLSSTDANDGVIRELAQLVSPETLQLYYQIGLIGKRDIALSPSLRVGFEMSLLRMLAFEPASPQQTDHSRLSSVKSSQTVVSGPASQAHQALSNSASRVADSPESVSPAPSTAVPRNDLGQMPQSESLASPIENMVPTEALTSPVKPVPQAVPTPSPREVFNSSKSLESSQDLANRHPVEGASEESPSDQAVNMIAITLAGNNEWGELIEQTDLIGLPKELAMNCACEKLSDDMILLTLAPNKEHLLRPERLQNIEQAVAKVLKKNTKISLDVELSDRETPAECLQRLGHEQFEQTREQLRNDPGVNAFIQEFGATLNEESIKPI